MHKLIGLALALALVILAAAGSAADDTPDSKANGKHPDPERVFKKIDTNGDGKLSREEFRTFIQQHMKGKSHPPKLELIDKLFDRLDTNADGYLSLEEFKKLPELRQMIVDRKKAKKAKEENSKNE